MNAASVAVCEAVSLRLPPVPIAYFTNQYPKVSHSFVRREILALEAHGVQVHRFALRGWVGRR